MGGVRAVLNKDVSFCCRAGSVDVAFVVVAYEGNRRSLAILRDFINAYQSADVKVFGSVSSGNVVEYGLVTAALVAGKADSAADRGGLVAGVGEALRDDLNRGGGLGAVLQPFALPFEVSDGVVEVVGEEQLGVGPRGQCE